MRALGEPDAFPSSDLGLLRATAQKSSRDLELRAEAWRPWRAYAAMYLWRVCSQRPTHEKKSRPVENQAVASTIAAPHQPMYAVV